MNNLNSVILEGFAYNRNRGESIDVRTRRYKTGPDAASMTEITVAVLAMNERAAESMLKLVDGQGARITGRLVEHEGAIAVGADHIELRRMRKPEQVDLVEATA